MHELPDDLVVRLADVTDATAALTRAAERADPDAVADAIEARALALTHLGAWFERRDGDHVRALHRRVAGELETGLVEARDALERMRGTAKVALDALRDTRAIRGYAGDPSTRTAAALDRAG